MQNYLRPKYHLFTASLFLSAIIAIAPARTATADSGKVTGQWDFDQGDLRATVGTDMQYGDAPGETAMRDHTSFGTTTSFGIPDIGGKPAKVMKYTRDENPPVPIGPRGYLLQHGIAPNGGGTYVNQFTMIVDFMIPDLHQGDGYNTVVKWEAVDDFSIDGSISIKANDIGGDNTGGIGISGQYTGDGNTWIIGGQWQRLVVAVDMVGADPNDLTDGTIDYYLDGVKFGQMTTGDRWGFDARHAIPQIIRMYGDGEGDNEVNTVYVNSIQFREGTMSHQQAATLGAATADGIPAPSNRPIDITHVGGQWDFDQGDLRATVGTDAEYGDGPTGLVQAHTSFGTTTSFGIPDIGGKVARVMKFTRIDDSEYPDSIDKNPRGYVLRPGLLQNGGGTKVNQFTMIVDFMIPDLHLGDAYNTVVKWEAMDDIKVDGSISIQGNDIGGDNTGGIGISGQYRGDGITWIIGGQWQRLVVAVDMVGADPNDLTDGTIDYYLDGVKFGQMTTGDRWGFDNRHAIAQFVRLYGDGENDNEVNTVYVNSVQFRDGTMDAATAAALGAASADGIPIPTTSSPTLAYSLAGTKLTLSWDAAITGFNLESGDSLSAPTWSPVQGVVNNSVAITIEAGNKFFRLKKP